LHVRTPRAAAKAPPPRPCPPPSTDLRYDARRDLEDVNAGDVEVFPPDKDALPKGRLADVLDEGVLFVTYRLGGVGGLGGGTLRLLRAPARAACSDDPGSRRPSPPPTKPPAPRHPHGSLIAKIGGADAGGNKRGALSDALRSAYNGHMPAAGGRGAGRGRGRGRGRGSRGASASNLLGLNGGAADEGRQGGAPEGPKSSLTPLEKAAVSLSDAGVKPGSRLWQIVEWLAGEDGEGECLIVFDEVRDLNCWRRQAYPPPALLTD
jgi:hypothetical protein